MITNAVAIHMTVKQQFYYRDGCNYVILYLTDYAIYGPFHVTCVTVWTLFSVNN